MKSPNTHMKQTASFRIVGFMLTIATLWLMLAVANTSAHAQTSNNVSNASAAPSPADWTQFHRDNMQRWNPYETVLGVNNANSLQVKWRNPLGKANTVRPSSPAVVNGVLYFGSGDYNLYAVNTSTGVKLWSFATGFEVDSSPAVANGVVYFGSLDGSVYAVNANTGAKVWSFAAGGYVYSSPAVANGVVYVGSADYNVYALNAATGAKLWSYTTGSYVLDSPAVANGVVYIGSEDHNVYALNASTGAKLWSFDTGGSVDSSPAVANGVVYVIGGTDTYDEASQMFALNARTGAEMWSIYSGYRTGSTSPAVANGVVYFGDGDGNTYALNANSGAMIWTNDVGNSDFEFSAPAVANGLVYFTSIPNNPSDDGTVYALNATTGVKLWSYTTQGVGRAFADITSPTVVGGVVYVVAGGVSTNNNVYAFSVGADLFLRVIPSATVVHQGDLLTFAFPVWNLGPANAVHEVLNTQVPAGTTFNYIRISGTPGLGTCTHPPYQGTGQIICHENASMAPNSTWTVRLTVKVTAPSGTVITESAATMSDSTDPNLANNTATVSIRVQ